MMGFTRRTTALATAVVAASALLVSCQTGAEMWGPCTPAGDGNPTGTDGEYVLVCTDGIWVPTMTVDEWLALFNGDDIDVAPLPTQPTTTTTTTSTTSTSTTTTTVPAVYQSQYELDEFCQVDGHDGATIQLCHYQPDTARTNIIKSGPFDFDCDMSGGSNVYPITSISGDFIQGDQVWEFTETDDTGTTGWSRFDATIDLDDGPFSLRIWSLTFSDTAECVD